MWNSNLESTYSALDIRDGASLADEDVGVAYYKSSLRPEGCVFPRDALVFIAESRKSRFLRFLATIGEHLNEKNVAVLAEKTFATSPEPEGVGAESLGAGTMGEAPAGEESSQTLASEASESEMDMDAYGEPYATSQESPSEPRSPSSSEASFSSSDGMNADSDFSDEVAGVFFDGNIWRCEECSMELVDSKCPNGHMPTRCQTCGWQLDNGPCQKCLSTCSACAGEMVDGQCDSCGESKESEEEDSLTWDERDNLWRCFYCQWEVEAENETDGNCHCLNDKGEACFIDLSHHLDYEPADSCSSEDDSTDSEPDSDDEGFIDDTEIPMVDIAQDAVVETVNLAALYSARHVAEILKAAEMAKAAKVATDKENVEPAVGSDDVGIIDTPTSSLPSNIVDCENMDI